MTRGRSGPRRRSPRAQRGQCTVPRPPSHTARPCTSPAVTRLLAQERRKRPPHRNLCTNVHGKCVKSPTRTGNSSNTLHLARASTSGDTSTQGSFSPIRGAAGTPTTWSSQSQDQQLEPASKVQRCVSPSAEEAPSGQCQGLGGGWSDYKSSF